MSQVEIPVDLILQKIDEERHAATSKLKKGFGVLTGELDTDISTTPYETVYSEDRVKLKHYIPEKIRCRTPLVIIYALINRETMLDLQPGRSVVELLLKEGIEVYMIDWGYPTRKDQYQTIDDHVNGYIANIVEHICAAKEVDKVNIMGICMGGVFSIIYTALHPHRVRNLVTTVTPTNFETDKGLLNVWMKQTDAQVLGDAYANMPGDIMNLGFLLLNPARLMIDKYVGFLQNIDDKNYIENFIRMEKWIFDSPDVPAATFKQFIVDFYKKNLLIQSRLEIGGKRVDLKKITVPILNFYGQFDHLVPPEACDRFTSEIGSTDKEDICLKTGHIGIYVSSKCQKEFVPKIAHWLSQRDN
ncbi:class III poly(R)-hydroxyalkanoic acid synthase subunit PhaC [Desulforhopalus singaporensis]|uniref:Poly(3-hydroxyalkanoate) polymerase subunit PhaC n=1 Tax=Desulforhopalus singaporensis TaxID=91360 RepID=A0A1H0J1J5_9BACT|nr:class III poly(R)-hydroxyalkanoic acid synthase subunit PhaC [Desulforhopalus singaporensis]SDO37617.1 polyhydroxyalkanoate synthase [Desulforhopalus singaporensis]